MDEEDYVEQKEQVWDAWLDNDISPDQCDKRLEDIEEEYRRYGN